VDYPTPKREIFAYHDGNDGKDAVFADPLVIRANLNRHAGPTGKTVQEWIDMICSGDLNNFTQMEVNAHWDALINLAMIVTNAFPMVPFDAATGKGADVDHCIAVLDHFNRWCQKKNQRQDSPSTCSPSAESNSATPTTGATLSV